MKLLLITMIRPTQSVSLQEPINYCSCFPVLTCASFVLIQKCILIGDKILMWLHFRKVSAEEDIYRQYDSLVNAIKESHIEAAKQLEELYQQQKQKLDAARQRVIDRKTKAETVCRRSVKLHLSFYRLDSIVYAINRI